MKGVSYQEPGRVPLPGRSRGRADDARSSVAPGSRHAVGGSAKEGCDTNIPKDAFIVIVKENPFENMPQGGVLLSERLKDH